ncbi:sigma-70 family RNA polymerase sigma factor [bacterium]|nr:sigma-70 family RNA polymerase sigma factor [bacterium]
MKKKPSRKIKKKKTKIVKNKVSEAELLEIIDIISKKLAYKFKFGYHEYDDMKQQITIFALEGFKNYDGIRPLENFLWTHVRNRLFNYKRDNYQRPDKPCLTCPLYDPHCKISNSQCSKFTDKNECSLYEKWSKRNNIKKNLMYLTSVEDSGTFEKNNKISFSENMANKEILDILDRDLNGEEREIYLKVKGGVRVNRGDMLKLTTKMRKILGNDNG